MLRKYLTDGIQLVAIVAICLAFAILVSHAEQREARHAEKIQKVLQELRP